MFQRLRRLRLLALFTLLASPGLGGSVLPAIMPCPVDAVVAEAQGNEGHAASHSGHHQQTDSSSTECCTCLGACIPAAAVTAAADRLPEPHLTIISTAPDLLPGSAPLSPPLDRLPPATAPPVII